MLINGTLYYNHGFEHSEKFTYNGYQMEKLTDKNYKGGYFNYNEFKFSDRAFDLNWENGQLENLCKTCDDLGFHISVYAIIWTEEEKQLAIDHICSKYPVTSDFCCIDHSTIEDFLPYDFAGMKLPHIMIEVDKFLNNKHSDLYDYLEWMLENEIKSQMDCWQENYGDEGVLDYIKACNDNALKNFPNDNIPEYHMFFDYDELSNYYIEDKNKFKEISQKYQVEKFRLIEKYTLDRDLGLI